MIDCKPQLVTALTAILPTHYELFVSPKTPTPCITYLESGNNIRVDGDTLGYSDVSYNIKVWAHDIHDIAQYAQQIDSALRPIGYTRISYNEMTDGALICAIMVYRGLGREYYN